MTDDQFRELRHLLLDLKVEMVEMNRRLSRLEDDAKRRHEFVMNAVAPVPDYDPTETPIDVQDMLRKFGTP